MKEIIAVLAISTKKELGWVKCATPFKDSWNDLGMHFPKDKVTFEAPGLYEVEFINNASFGSNPAYKVVKAQKIGTFAELTKMMGR